MLMRSWWSVLWWMLMMVWILRWLTMTTRSQSYTMNWFDRKLLSKSTCWYFGNYLILIYEVYRLNLLQKKSGRIWEDVFFAVVKIESVTNLDTLFLILLYFFQLILYITYVMVEAPRGSQGLVNSISYLILTRA